MVKNLIKLEHTIEGKVGQFLCDHDLSTQMAKEMMFQFLKYLGSIEDAAALHKKAAEDAAAKPAEEVESPKAE